MKPRKQNLIIAALLILLAWSIILNLLQGEQVERLMKEMEDMEYIQSILSSQIQELEETEGVADGE